MEKQVKSIFWKRERIEEIFWVGIGVIICVLALQLDLGSFHEPGPGFVALFSGLFLSCIGVGMIISGAVSKKLGQGAEAHSTFQFDSWRRLMYTMGLLLMYTVLLNRVGFILTTVLAMFGLFFDWEQRNWFWSAFFSIATALVSYLVFEIWLHCQLPRGLFPWW